MLLLRKVLEISSFRVYLFLPIELEIQEIVTGDDLTSDNPPGSSSAVDDDSFTSSLSDIEPLAQSSQAVTADQIGDFTVESFTALNI